jgi:hypothetical protein
MRATLRMMSRCTCVVMPAPVITPPGIPPGLSCADITDANRANIDSHMDLILPCNIGAVIYDNLTNEKTFNLSLGIITV